VRDESSTSYTGAIAVSEEFGRRLYTEAWERGWGRAEKKVVLGDGAVWIWNIADREFPGAIQIVDLYHAREHLWDLAGRLFPNEKNHRPPTPLISDSHSRKLPKSFGSRPSISHAMPTSCDIHSSASRSSSSARA